VVAREYKWKKEKGMIDNGYYNPFETEEIRARDIESFENFHDVFTDSEKRFKHRTAVKYMVDDKVAEVSDIQFFDDVRAWSSVLIRQGAQYKHVAMIGPNSYNWILSYASILNIGSVAVLLAADSTPGQIAEQAAFTDVEYLVYDRALEASVLAAGLKNVKLISMQEGCPEGIASIADERKKGLAVIENRTKKDDLSLIFFTSGTTGTSKAVMLTNKQNYSGVTNFTLDYEALLIMLPLHHIAGFTIGLNSIVNGACLCIGTDPRQTQQYFSELKPDVTFVVPALLEVMRGRLSKVGYDQSKLGWNLRYLFCGGAAFQPGILEEIERAGMEIWQIYASSESGGQGILSRMVKEHEDAIGKDNMRCVIVDIIDDELVIKGDTVFKGYYKDPEATREVLYDGWYHTGDICRRDSEGYFYLIGRKKNVIVLSNGQNVSPEELEMELFAADKNHDISEVEVYGQNDVLMAEVFPNYDETMNEDEREAVRSRIRKLVEAYSMDVPTYKAIRKVVFRQQPFEKNALGKMVRRINR
jgi:long-chain acyl-CoA synthetase